MCHMSHVTCHMSRVTCHVSHVTCQMSHVTSHNFFKQKFLHPPKKLYIGPMIRIGREIQSLPYAGIFLKGQLNWRGLAQLFLKTILITDFLRISFKQMFYLLMLTAEYDVGFQCFQLFI